MTLRYSKEVKILEQKVIKDINDLKNHVISVRRYGDELDLYVPSNSEGLCQRIVSVGVEEVGANSNIKTYEDCMTHFHNNLDKYWELLIKRG
ncbi:hypothetical protein VPHK460_0035 [Vibrio phage K460]